MDARPYLEQIAALLNKHRLEAILIGNAAAALQGAPVTTIDFDFLFRKTPGNLRKLKAIATELDAVILRPYYPASGLHRISRDLDNLQLDFMTAIDGISSLGSLGRRAQRVSIGDQALLVAALSDIIRSKRAAGRPQDLATLPLLEKVLAQITHEPKREARGAQKGE